MHTEFGVNQTFPRGVTAQALGLGEPKDQKGHRHPDPTTHTPLGMRDPEGPGATRDQQDHHSQALLWA
ncbi:hypothetical protein EYF80_046937 [Liparis tanakae]|uniref:Uncharacterized protein n=1 Tax=Liparis tanakae TaxID=230148 RepID=A0A4Z2FNQ3_9TELE|nr:hypothetical protein EYF80_046937 [Liparis tanakae]